MAVQVEHRWIRREDADRLLSENCAIRCMDRDGGVINLIQVERHQEHREHRFGISRLLVVTPALPEPFGPDIYWAAVHYDPYRDDTDEYAWSYACVEQDEDDTDWILFQSVQLRAVMQVQYVGYDEGLC